MKRDREADRIAGIAMMLKQKIDLGQITKDEAMQRIEKEIEKNKGAY